MPTDKQGAISTDSHLRIYTSLDPSLNDWTTAHDVYVPSLAAPGSTEDGGTAGAENAADQASGGWGLSWCREKWWGSIIAVFTGTNSTVKVSSVCWKQKHLRTRREAGEWGLRAGKRSG